jgi:preprotein translocase subunit SecA
MITNILKKIIGTKNERELKRIQPLVEKANSFEEEYMALSDKQLKAKTPFFKERLEQGEELDELLPEAFAATRVLPSHVAISAILPS